MSPLAGAVQRWWLPLLFHQDAWLQEARGGEDLTFFLPCAGVAGAARLPGRNFLVCPARCFLHGELCPVPGS